MPDEIAKNLTQEYWDKLLCDNTDLKGVGWPNWPESYNLILYKKYLKGFENVIRDLSLNYNIKLNDKLKIFEAGPGSGFYTNYFWQAGVKDYTGADISEASVGKLKIKYPDFNFVRKDVSISDNFITDNESKYDLICIVDVLLHITEDTKFRSAVENLGKLLKPGGYIIVGDAISVYRKESHSKGTKYTHDVSRHIDLVREVFSKSNLELKNIYHRKNFFLNKNFDYRFPFLGLFSNFFFFFLNGGLTVFRNNNFVGKLVGYPLSFCDSLITPFQRYSKNSKFLLFRKKF